MVDVFRASVFEDGNKASMGSEFCEERFLCEYERQRYPMGSLVWDRAMRFTGL